MFIIVQLTILMFNEDVLLLESFFIDNNIRMINATLSYETASLSNISSSPIPILATTSSMTTVFSNQNRFLILKWSVRIIGGLLIIVGGIGNTLSALTLSRKKLRAQVTSVYLIALALSDLGKYIINLFISVNFLFFR
jgi:hypothetical protein